MDWFPDTLQSEFKPKPIQDKYNLTVAILELS